MATLQQDVQDRFSAQYLTNLTQPGSPEQTGLGSTKLDRACTDVQADFETTVGVAYDSNQPRHVSIAVDGVIAKLVSRTGQAQRGDSLHDRYITRLEGLREIITAASSSQLSPIDERRGAALVRPAFDDGRFDRYVPEAPAGDADWPTTLP